MATFDRKGVLGVENDSRSFHPEIPLDLPILDFPTPIVENVLFYVNRVIKNDKELTEFVLGSKFQATQGSFNIPALKSAILVNVEAQADYSRNNVYRFYYLVPYQDQHLYNIEITQKDIDAYNFENFNFPWKTSVPVKLFLKIQRIFVIPKEEAYERPHMKSKDPSGLYDADFYHEEVLKFEEPYLEKLFRKVVRYYKTLPGPVILDYLAPTTWERGRTVWAQGGPGQPHPWIAAIGRRWSREAWLHGIPKMPPEAENASPVTKGWDKTEFPAIGLWQITEIYPTESGISNGGVDNELSVDGCEPPSLFVKSRQTTTVRISNVIWKDIDGDDVPLPDLPDPPADCDNYMVSAEQTDYDGRAVNTTTIRCIKYETVPKIYESQIDSRTGSATLITRELIPSFLTTDNFPSGEMDENGYAVEIKAHNPCWSEKITRCVNVQGFQYSWNGTAQATFPPILKQLTLEVWSKRGGGNDTKPNLFYWGPVSGACKAIITEGFWKFGTKPPWADTATPPFLTGDFHYSCPYFTVDSRSCLHGLVQFQVFTGDNDPIYQPHISYYTCTATPETSWRDIIEITTSPVQGGMIWRQTIISPPKQNE